MLRVADMGDATLRVVDMVEEGGPEAGRGSHGVLLVLSYQSIDGYFHKGIGAKADGISPIFSRSGTKRTLFGT